MKVLNEIILLFLKNHLINFFCTFFLIVKIFFKLFFNFVMFGLNWNFCNAVSINLGRNTNCVVDTTLQFLKFGLFDWNIFFTLSFNIFFVIFCIFTNKPRFLKRIKNISSHIRFTDKRTDVWSRDFIIWKINSGLWSWLDCEIKGSGPIMSNFWGPFFSLFTNFF